MDSGPRRNSKPSSVCDSAQPPEGDVGTDFFAVMRCVASLLSADSTTVEELFKKLVSLVEALIAKSELPGPLPPRKHEQLQTLLDAVNAFPVADYVRLSQSVPLERIACVHPIVEMLLRMNFEHLEKAFGRDIAEREVTKVFRAVVPSRRPGKPSRIPVETLQKAKTLHDRGLSYAQIGLQVGLSRTAVRTALQYWYPEA